MMKEDEKLKFSSKGEIANAIQTLTPFALVRKDESDNDGDLKETKKAAFSKINELIKLF